MPLRTSLPTMVGSSSMVRLPPVSCRRALSSGLSFSRTVVSMGMADAIAVVCCG